MWKEEEDKLTQNETILHVKNTQHENIVAKKVDYKVCIYPIILNTIITLTAHQKTFKAH